MRKKEEQVIGLRPQALGGSMTEKRISELENLEISKFVGGVQWECGDGKMKRSDIQNKDKLYKKLEISGLIE